MTQTRYNSSGLFRRPNIVILLGATVPLVLLCVASLLSVLTEKRYMICDRCETARAVYVFRYYGKPRIIWDVTHRSAPGARDYNNTCDLSLCAAGHRWLVLDHRTWQVCIRMLKAKQVLRHQVEYLTQVDREVWPYLETADQMAFQAEQCEGVNGDR
jgi:hypothetical protein